MQFLNPMGRDRRYPQEGQRRQNSSDQEGLQRALPIDPASQQKIQPDKPRVMGLDGEAGCKTQDAGTNKPLLEKAPYGH